MLPLVTTAPATAPGRPADSIASLMTPPLAVFPPDHTVAATIEALRTLTKEAFITYGYVTDAAGRLQGVVVMRDLMLADPAQTLAEIMLRDPFWLPATMPLAEALKEALTRHYPVYPVCDDGGVLAGLVRGEALFAQQAIEISAQPGSMVGIEKEERLATPLARCLKLRHPWLQVNLVTAFAAAAVVGVFQQTLDRIVLLAVFLPVMAGQSGNTGCQALAVALRGITLGDLKPGRERQMVVKEALLGLCNGIMVGLTAGAGMFVYARFQKQESAWLMGLIVMLAMVVSCVLSGLCGALIPLVLRKAGADPATASSIFLTTATDVASMGVFLALATWWLC